MTTPSPVRQGISISNEDWLEDALEAAPRYSTKLALAIRRTIRCIHGLEDLHEIEYRADLEIYLGRATKGTIFSRWKQHAKKGHNNGIILFRCDPERVVALEEISIKILKSLKDRDMLCVGSANIRNDGAGSQPRSEDALVYMTWKRRATASKEQAKPTLNDIREIATLVKSTSIRYPVTVQQIETGLNTLKRQKEFDKLYWWNP